MMKTQLMMLLVTVGTAYAERTCSTGHFLETTYVTHTSRRRRRTGRVLKYACVPCTTGRFSIGGSKDSCEGCPSGKWQGLTGTSTCDGTSCPSGKYGNIASSVSSTCVSCPSGKYQSHPGKDGCIDCSAGTSMPDSGSTSCTGTPCADGSIGPIGSTTSVLATCKECPAGRFEIINRNVCLICPSGKYQPVHASVYCIDADKLSFGTRWIPDDNSDGTIPPMVGDCLFTLWRETACYMSVVLFCLVYINMYLIHIYYSELKWPYIPDRIMMIYTICVSLLTYNCYYVNENSYIAIGVISSAVTLYYIGNILCICYFSILKTTKKITVDKLSEQSNTSVI